MKERNIAQANQKRVIGLRLGTEALNRFDPSANGLAVSGILAIESLKADPTFEGRKAMAQVVRLIPGSPQVIPKVHNGEIRSLAFSPDGRWMASGGGQDGRVVLWDLSSAMQRSVLTTPQPIMPPVFSLTFSSDSRWLAAGTNHAVWIWDVLNRTVQGLPIQHANVVKSVTFGDEGEWLATATQAGRARLFHRVSDVWNEEYEYQGAPLSRKEEPSLHYLEEPGPTEHHKQADTVAFTHKGLMIAGNDGIWISSMHDWRDFVEFHQCRAAAVGKRNDGTIVAVICNEGLVSANLNESSQQPTYTTVPGRGFSSSYGISVSDGGDYIAAIDNSGAIHLFGNPITQEQKLIAGQAVSVAFRRKGEGLAAGLRDGSIAFWPTSKGNEAIPLPYHGIAGGLAFSPDEKWLAATSDDGSVQLFDLSRIENIRQFPAIHLGPDLQSVGFSPDGQLLAVLAKTKLYVIERESRKLVRSYDMAGQGFVAGFSPDSRLLVAMDESGIHRFDSRSGLEERKVIQGNFDDLRFSPDGQWLATFGRTNPEGRHHYIELTQIWQLKNGLELAWQEKGREASDGPSRPSEGGPQNLIGDSKNWKPLAQKYVSPGRVWQAELDTYSSTLRLSEASSGREVAKLEHDGDLVAFAFSPQNRWVATSSQDRRVRIWPLRVDEVIAQACKLLPRNLTPDEWKAYQPGRVYQKTCPNLP